MAYLKFLAYILNYKRNTGRLDSCQMWTKEPFTSLMWNILSGGVNTMTIQAGFPWLSWEPEDTWMHSSHSGYELSPSFLSVATLKSNLGKGRCIASHVQRAEGRGQAESHWGSWVNDWSPYRDNLFSRFRGSYNLLYVDNKNLGEE